MKRRFLFSLLSLFSLGGIFYEKLCSIVLIFLLFTLAACTNEQDTISSQKQQTVRKATTTVENQLQTEIPSQMKKPLKIALIMQMSIGTFSSQYIEGVKNKLSYLAAVYKSTILITI